MGSRKSDALALRAARRDIVNQSQFNTLDALIVAQIGKSDYHELAIWAALAIGLAGSLTLTTSTQLAALAMNVWG